jgi:hypothetical protein
MSVAEIALKDIIEGQRTRRREPSDALSRAGAERLASKIREHWQRRGFTNVTTNVAKIEKGDLPRDGAHYTVTSNLVAGWPPRQARHG